MSAREPVMVTNLDRYGSPALDWGRVRDQQEKSVGEDLTFFLGTTGPDGRPHAAGVGAVWVDGNLYCVSGPGTRKSRDLAARPACTFSVRLQGIDLVLEGEANRVTDPSTLEKLAGVYRLGGWPAEVDGDTFTAPYSAPSAGPPPWYLYSFTCHTALAVASAEPHGATRWRFDGKARKRDKV